MIQDKSSDRFRRHALAAGFIAADEDRLDDDRSVTTVLLPEDY